MHGVWSLCSMHIYASLSHRQSQSLITLAQRKRGIHTYYILLIASDFTLQKPPTILDIYF